MPAIDTVNWVARPPCKVWRQPNMRLARSEVEAAIGRCPLQNTTDIKDLRDYPFLFGVLMDRRIRGEDW
jgi:hypothetical protein